MIKELHLVIRTLFTLSGVYLFSKLTGLAFLTSPMNFVRLLAVGFFILMLSLMFQYYVLHFALKHIPAERYRALFLVAWTVVSVAGIFITSLSTPSLREYGSGKALEDAWAAWLGSYIFFWGVFIGSACARRAWQRHGSRA